MLWVSGRPHRLRQVSPLGDHAPRAPHLATLPDQRHIYLYDVLRHTGDGVVFLRAVAHAEPRRRLQSPRSPRSCGSGSATKFIDSQ